MDHPESRQYSDYREGWSGRESERKFFLQVRVCSQISPPVNGFRVKKGQVEYIKSQTRTSLIETPTKRLYLTINLMFLFWVQLIAVQGTVWQQRPLVSPSSFIQVWGWHCDSEKNGRIIFGLASLGSYTGSQDPSRVTLSTFQIPHIHKHPKIPLCVPYVYPETTISSVHQLTLNLHIGWLLHTMSYRSVLHHRGICVLSPNAVLDPVSWFSLYKHTRGAQNTSSRFLHADLLVLYSCTGPSSSISLPLNL